MLNSHEPSPSAMPFATHEGRMFMQHLAGRTAAARDLPPPEAADSELLDLADRVRNSGEW